MTDISNDKDVVHMSGRIETVETSLTTSLAGRVAIVTGGARGQGRSHALTLARAGADVILADIVAPIATAPYALATEDDLAETEKLVCAEGRKGIGIKADVRAAADMDAVAELAMSEFGRLDIVIANAGIFSFAAHSWELSDEQWREMTGVCLDGVFQTLKATVPRMIEAGNGGAITITSSINGFRGIAGTAHYTAAKHGVIGLMRTFAVELAPYWIRVNTVHPTATATPMISHEGMAQQLARSEAAGTVHKNMLDVGALDPQDVSNAIVWLSSDQARYVTGITMPVDAGYLLK